MSDQKPTGRLLKDHPDADLVLLLAIRWRREQLKKDTLAESAYALAMGQALDEMVHDLAEKAGGK